MANVSVNATRAIHSLGNLGKRAANPRKPLKMIGHYVKELSMQAFQDSEDPVTHKKWKPLSPETIRQRRYGKGKRRIKILVDTRTLQRSVHANPPKKTSVTIGTPLVYGRNHQLGSTVPRRRFLGVDREGMIEIQRIMRKYLETGK